FTHYASRLTIYHVIIVGHCHLPINIEGILLRFAQNDTSIPFKSGLINNSLFKAELMNSFRL
ncbi:hypothetical protein JW964_16575, partial [candidate division KSB1 bacterium]|nr:hypothetical protein [candidate division KSB1 bacterium]